jgi:multisubunit Na+/H+ antiporter MnhB subunit
MNVKQMRKWEKTSAKGKRRFLLVHGLLIPGLTFVLIALLTSILWRGNLFVPNPSRNETPKIIILLPALLISLAASYYLATKVWDSSERKYKAALEDKEKVRE